jgi:hypothetical protein
MPVKGAPVANGPVFASATVQVVTPGRGVTSTIQSVGLGSCPALKAEVVSARLSHEMVNCSAGHTTLLDTVRPSEQSGSKSYATNNCTAHHTRNAERESAREVDSYPTRMHRWRFAARYQ